METKMTKSEFLAENSQYIRSERLLSNLAQIPDDKWDIVVACVELANSGGTEPGLDCDVVITHETLEDFEASRKGWRECASMKNTKIAGHAALTFSGVQMYKGQSRRDFVVLDLGDIRVVLE
jgi:hypothetical protein